MQNAKIFFRCFCDQKQVRPTTFVVGAYDHIFTSIRKSTQSVVSSICSHGIKSTIDEPTTIRRILNHRLSYNHFVLNSVPFIIRPAWSIYRICIPVRCGIRRWKTHLFLTGLTPSGRSTRSHTWLSSMDCNSDFMALSHSSESSLDIASLKVKGSTSFDVFSCVLMYLSGAWTTLEDLLTSGTWLTCSAVSLGTCCSSVWSEESGSRSRIYSSVTLLPLVSLERNSSSKKVPCLATNTLLLDLL